ncbi:MAG: diacylglycerol kinase [Synergistaceae bacterium]|nr:diacylglycerol kinase [Synergistaceae bacterium]
MRRYSPAARLYHATRYSLNGLLAAFREEQSFEYEAVVLVVLLAVVLTVGAPFPEAVALIGCWLAVMAFELVNGAVERAFDLIDQEHNPHIKAGKDMLSAAVFLMILFNAVLWGVFFYRGIFY